MRRAHLFPLLGGAMLTSAGLSAPPTQAAYLVTLTQTTSGVVETGDGSLDLTALSFLTTNSPPPPGGEEARVIASVGLVVLGPTSPTSINVYTGLTGPASFGSGVEELANSGSGSLVGVAGSLPAVGGIPILGVPVGYVSGSSLGTSTDTWDGATFASLGVTRGVYTWTWGSGNDADSFRLVVGGAVPEPGTWTLMAVGFAGLGFAAYRATKKNAALPA